MICNNSTDIDHIVLYTIINNIYVFRYTLKDSLSVTYFYRSLVCPLHTDLQSMLLDPDSQKRDFANMSKKTLFLLKQFHQHVTVSCI